MYAVMVVGAACAAPIENAEATAIRTRRTAPRVTLTPDLFGISIQLLFVV